MIRSKSLPEEYFSIALDDAYWLIDKFIRATLSTYSLTKSEYMLLRNIENRPGVQASEVKVKMRMTGPSISALVHSLEKKRMIDRAQDPNDTRKLSLHLTAHSKHILEEVRKTFESILAESGIHGALLSSLTQSLKHLTTSLSPYVS